MNVFLGGARGSLPGGGADKIKYGGETFALLVEGCAGEQILVDAGSGIQRVVDRVRPGATLFFTHTHLDHLIGLPLLGGVWPRQLVSPRGGLPEILARVFSPPIWPVDLPAGEYPEPGASMMVGGLNIRWQEVAHPDGCLAIRVDEAVTGAALVVATDIEWGAMAQDAQDAFVDFARQADLLVFDAHYTPREYADHHGWGHSSWTDAVAVARRCGVDKLWLIHHAPERTDAEIDQLGVLAAAEFPGAVFPAADARMEIAHE